MVANLQKEKAMAYRIKGLTKVYGDGPATVHALRGVDLEIPAGEIIVLLGPSGSGKSTLLNIIGGLDKASDGQVHFQDQELTTFSDAELTRYRRNYVGFVFQFYNLMPSLTAHENVEDRKSTRLNSSHVRISYAVFCLKKKKKKK